jgi:hypothetical protein
VKKQVLRTRTAFPPSGSRNDNKRRGRDWLPRKKVKQNTSTETPPGLLQKCFPACPCSFQVLQGGEDVSEGANGFPNTVQAKPEHGKLASTATEMLLDMPMLLPVLATSTLWPDVGLTLGPSQKLLRAGSRPIPSPVEKR